MPQAQQAGAPPDAHADLLGSCDRNIASEALTKPQISMRCHAQGTLQLLRPHSLQVWRTPSGAMRCTRRWRPICQRLMSGPATLWRRWKQQAPQWRQHRNGRKRTSGQWDACSKFRHSIPALRSPTAPSSCKLAGCLCGAAQPILVPLAAPITIQMLLRHIPC